MSEAPGTLTAREPGARYLVELEPTLTRGFELLATAQHGVPRVRGLLLSLAVQGKLIPQEASDEPADVLLARIYAEKSSHAVSGRIKRAKDQRATSNLYEPFEIPSSWVWARLGEITTFGTCDKASDIADTTWVLDLEDIEKDTGRIARRASFAERRSLSDKNVFRVADVLYGKLRPYLNKVVVADAGGVCTTEILPFRGYGSIDPHYLRTVIQSPYFLAYVNSKSYGMKMPRLGTDDGRNAWVPLPPLAEQHRIVARVEELMKLCDALEQNGRLADEQHARLTSTLFNALATSESAQALAENWQRVAEHFDLLLDRTEAIDALEQTVLELAVRGLLVPLAESDEPVDVLLSQVRTERDRLIAIGQIRKDRPVAAIDEDELSVSLPHYWKWARLGALVDASEAGWSPNCDGSPRAGNAWGVLKVSAVSWGRFRSYENKELPSHLEARPEFEVRDGDFLISRANTAELVARSVVVSKPEPRLMMSDKIIRLRLSNFVDRNFFNLVNNSRMAREYYAANASGTSSSMKNVGREVILGMPVPVPPLAEQHRIVARVEELRSLCSELRQRLTDARKTQSRLADALVAEVA